MIQIYVGQKLPKGYVGQKAMSYRKSMESNGFRRISSHCITVSSDQVFDNKERLINIDIVYLFSFSR